MVAAVPQAEDHAAVATAAVRVATVVPAVRTAADRTAADRTAAVVMAVRQAVAVAMVDHLVVAVAVTNPT